MPTQIMHNYDLSIPLKAPDTTLKLEWMYPFCGLFFILYLLS
ncbi:unnamed protein product [Schistosoma mattheei]|uniref:Uncharacterized protein n=1 Tax=Schistosoma mattheei TaxID=31246 RepID=A0A183PS65_9TREM|nr:unnamed protein product [Schistosoma mattheei]